MSGPVLAVSPQPLSSRCDLDLRGEARQFFRQRIRVAGVGLVLGIAFEGIGAYAVGRQASTGFSADYLIAFFVVALGLVVIGVSLYMGLLNPVTRIRATASGVIFERRWGGALGWQWRDPQFRLDIDDRTLDPVGSSESHRHLFFEGPGPIYGNLTPSTLGPLLDTARTYGAPVSMKQIELNERGEIHLVRRIRVRPPPTR